MRRVSPNGASVDFSVFEGLVPSFGLPNDSDESNDNDDCCYDLATKKRRVLHDDDEVYEFGTGGGDTCASSSASSSNPCASTSLSKSFAIRGDEEDLVEVAAPLRGSRHWIVGVDCGLWVCRKLSALTEQAQVILANVCINFEKLPPKLLREVFSIVKPGGTPRLQAGNWSSRVASVFTGVSFRYVTDAFAFLRRGSWEPSATIAPAEHCDTAEYPRDRSLCSFNEGSSP
jgi:hypothetical protein